MNESINSPALLDEFEDFLDGDPYWEEVDEYVAELHGESHAAGDVDLCRACDELFDMAEEALDE